MTGKPERYDRKRGRHKKRASAETQTWEAEHLVPKRPPWLDPETYRKLCEMRNA